MQLEGSKTERDKKHTQWHSYRQNPEEASQGGQHMEYNGVQWLVAWYVVLLVNDAHQSPRFCVQPDLPEASHQLCCTSLPSYCKHTQTIRFTWSRSPHYFPLIIFIFITLFSSNTVYHFLLSNLHLQINRSLYLQIRLPYIMIHQLGSTQVRLAYIKTGQHMFGTVAYLNLTNVEQTVVLTYEKEQTCYTKVAT